MSAARRLDQVRQVARIQRVECDATGGDVAIARDAEADARRAAADAVATAAALADAWYGTVTVRLDPDASGLAGRRLIAAEQDATASAQAAAAASDRLDAQIDRWRHLDARRRATGQVADALARDVARRRDEAMLGTIADRVTMRWSRG